MDPIHPTPTPARLVSTVSLHDMAKGRKSNSGNLLANFSKNIRQSAAVPAPPQAIPSTQPLPPLSHTEGFRPRSNSEETVRDSVSVDGNDTKDGPLQRQNSRETLPDTTDDTALRKTCSLETLPDIAADSEAPRVALGSIPGSPSPATQAVPSSPAGFPSTQVVSESPIDAPMRDAPKSPTSASVSQVDLLAEEAFAQSQVAACASTQVVPASPANAASASTIVAHSPIHAASSSTPTALDVPDTPMSQADIPDALVSQADIPDALVSQGDVPDAPVAPNVLIPMAPKRRTKPKAAPDKSASTRTPCPVVSDALVARAPDELWEWDSMTDNFTIDDEYAVLKRTGAAAPFKIPLTVYRNLYDYQRSSLGWLAGLYLNRHGGILGDDMGMGKTVQVAALIAGVWGSKLGRHFLIAVPVTLIENWKRELTNWCAGLPIHVLYGTAKERHKALEDGYRIGGVVLTSYDLVKNIVDSVKNVSQPKAKPKRAKKRKATAFNDQMDELEVVEASPVLEEDHPWDIIVLDEAHRVKNAACRAANALRLVRARTRVMLSGTPLQNNLKELWSLMDICMPGLLGNRATFETAFNDPISAGSKRDATPYAVQLKDHLSRRLKRTIAPHFLRRTKDKVEEMSMIPPKTDILVWLKLAPEQERFYNRLLESDIVSQARTKNNNGGAAMFRSLRLLQNMCNHPLLSLSIGDYHKLMTTWGHVMPAIEEEEMSQEQWNTTELKEVITDTAESAARLSCKLRFLSVLLPALKEGGHRCLIFSQSTKMLNLIQMCVLRPLGLKFLRLDGTLHSEERDIKAAKFESPEGIEKFFCMCLSIQVGGVGLTLTSADRVVIVDPSWNPAVDMQAIDRTHRLGQTKPVVVYRLVGSGAIEDKMFRFQIFKRGVVKTLLEQENQTRYFTQKDMKDLFSFGEKTQSVLQEKGYELESERILNTITGDVGEVDQSNPFWSCEDLEGFADYSDLFSQLDPTTELDSEAQEQAQEAINKLREEEYVPEKYDILPLACGTPKASGSRADDDDLPIVALETPPSKRRKAWARK